MSLNRLNLFPYVDKIPKINLLSVNNSGGSLTSGSYLFAVCYIADDRTLTNFVEISKPVYISADLGSISFQVGSKAETPSNKSITLQFTNLDTFYKSMHIAVIPIINGVIDQPQLLPEIGVPQSGELTYTYTNQETYTLISLEEITINRAYYNSAGTIKYLDGTVYLANLEERKDIGYQKYANNIKVKPVYESQAGFISNITQNLTDTGLADSGASYRSPVISFNKKGYRLDEIYAIYIALVRPDGSETVAYHIPGRQAESVVVEEGTGDSAQGSLTINTKQVSNTASSELLIALTPNTSFPEFTGNLDVTSFITSSFGTRTTAEFVILSSDNTAQVSAKLAAAWHALANCTGDDVTPNGVIISSNDPLLEGQNISFGFTAAGLAGDITKLNDLYTQAITPWISPTTIVKRINITLPETFVRNINVTRADTIPDILNRIASLYVYSPYETIIAGSTITFNARNSGTEYNGGSVTLSDFDGTFTYSQSFTALTGGTETVPAVVMSELDAEDRFTWFNTQNGADARKFHFRSYSGANGMGFWQNEDEIYPDTEDWDIWDVTADGNGVATGMDIRGDNVRHHKFVQNSVQHFFPNPVTALSSVSAVVTGFQLEDIKIPEALKKETIGFKVYYALRSPENKTIIDQSVLINARIGGGLLRPQHRNQTDASLPVSTGAIQPDVYYTHPFSLLRKQQGIESVDYIKNIVKHTLDGTNELTGTQGTTTYISVLNLAMNTQNTDLDSTSLGQQVLKPVVGKSFVPSSSEEQLVTLQPFGISNNMDNNRGETKVVLELPLEESLALESSVLPYYTTNLCSFKTNLYNSFRQQFLVYTGHNESWGAGYNYNTDPIFGGDTYINSYAYRANKRHASENYSGVHLAVHQSDDNIAMRHVGDSFWQSFSPLITLQQFAAIRATNDGQFAYTDGDYPIYDPFIGYDGSMSYQNQIKGVFPQPFEPPINKFPTRIIRSRQETESTNTRLREFLQNDYKTFSQNRGKIVKLDAYNNNLIVHMERALIATKGREEIQVADARAYVGSGDIFSIKPDELIYTEEGFGGIQHINHSLSTPFGYYFVDKQTAKVFELTNNGITEISNNGMRKFFESNLPNWNITMGYDPENRRILFTGGDTISYSPEIKAWVSFHDFIPELYARTMKHLITYKGGALYDHEGIRGDYYFQQKDSSIQFVDNTSPETNKKVMSLEMYTEVFRNNDLQKHTFSEFRIQNSYQDTGWQDLKYFIDVVNEQEFFYIFGNVRRTERSWKVNKFRDTLNIPEGIIADNQWAYRKQLSDRYSVVSLRFKNEENKVLYFYTAHINYKPSLR